MCTCTEHQKRQFRVVLFPNQEPVSTNVTLTFVFLCHDSANFKQT